MSSSTGPPSWELTASFGTKHSRFRAKILVSFSTFACLVILASLHKWSDFLRKDLYEAIESGAFPKWKLGIQVIPASKEHDFDFDILDATKLWPEEQVPLEEIGELVLDRTPEEFFPEVEQVAFCTSNVVPGIGFSDDPLLQGRNFSYFDTQISRLGVNWQEVFVQDALVVIQSLIGSQLPVNRPVCPVLNHQRDGQMRHRITAGTMNYWPNRKEIFPPVPPKQGGYHT